MNIVLGIFLLLVSYVFGSNALASISGRYGAFNRWWNVVLAGSLATLGVIGAAYAFLSHMHVALGVVLLMLGVYSGMGFLASITGRYTVRLSDHELTSFPLGEVGHLMSPNPKMVLGLLIVSIVAFIGAVLLIT